MPGLWRPTPAAPASVRTWREITGDWDDAVTGRDVPIAPGGAEAVGRTGEFLGYGLVSLANALDPDIIVIGGGLAALGTPCWSRPGASCGTAPCPAPPPARSSPPPSARTPPSSARPAWRCLT